MRVVLPQSIFETAGVYELDGLLRVLVERAHTLIVNPPWEAGDEGCLDRWLKGRDRHYRELWPLILEPALIESGGQPASTLEVQVITDGESRWSECRLSLRDATELLGAPLRLYLENETSDLSFLKRIADSKRRSSISEALRDGRLEVRHGGGNSSMEATLSDLHRRRRVKDRVTSRRAWIESWRIWVLFDRDADRGDATRMHRNARALKTACERLGLPHQVTGRRAIENYLPESALSRWVESGNKESRGQRKRKVIAFFSEEFGSRRRACLHMKTGLKKDLDDNDERLPPPFAELDFTSPPGALLRDGFGDRIAECYADSSLPDAPFHMVFEQDDEAREFREQIFTSLFGRL